MNDLMLSDCAAATGGTLLGSDLPFMGVGIDTRQSLSGKVYVAISGESFDGHKFVPGAVAGGAAAVVVEHDCGVDVPQLIVRNTRHALGAIARLWRRRHAVELVSITGSNGKTTVKEMVASILSHEGQVLATQGNLNNDIGVPLTLFRLDATDKFAVVELGANAPKEIGELAAIAEPRVVVVNNVGPAHLEGFGGLQGVAKAKGEIYDQLPEDGVALINLDEPAANQWIERVKSGQVKTFSMREGSGADLIGQITGANTLSVTVNGETHALTVSLLGEHNKRNALTATAVGLALGASWESISQGIAEVKPVQGRLCEEMAGGVRLIDDSYNANPGSVDAALRLLSDYAANRWFVLGTMAELGAQAEESHVRAGRQAAALGIERFACVGEYAVAARRGFGPKGMAFDNHDKLVEELLMGLKPGDSVLLKGSRSASMEQVVQALSKHLGEHEE